MKKNFSQLPRWAVAEECQAKFCKAVASFFEQVGLDIEFCYNEETSDMHWTVPDYARDFAPKLIKATNDIWESALNDAVSKATEEAIAWLKRAESRYDEESIRNVIWKVIAQKKPKLGETRYE